LLVRVQIDAWYRLWAKIQSRGHSPADAVGLDAFIDRGIRARTRQSERFSVVEFPSYEMAKTCYEDPAYQEARQFASRGASKRDPLIFRRDRPELIAPRVGPLRVLKGADEEAPGNPLAIALSNG